MTNTELRDNLCYIAALQKVTALRNTKRMTAEEYGLIKKELERRLRPTVATLA